MINYKEARAGNLVMYDNRLFQIEAISRSLPCLNTDEFGIGVVDWGNIQPIVLSPEILEKCGFTLNHVDQLAIVLNSMDRHLELNAEVNGNYFFSINQMGEFGDSSNVTLNYIQYLHQLQNLYWCLCGKELEINLQ